MATARPCLTCQRPTRNGSRCPTCESQRQAKRNASRAHYKGEWQAISRAAREAQPWCSVCGATTDLTTDHITAASLADGVMVLCRKHNSSKGAR